MRPSLTDEIIDAIIQNEGRHVERPRERPGTRFLAARREAPAPAGLAERGLRTAAEDAEPRRPA